MSFLDIFKNTTPEEKELEKVLILKLSPLGIGKKEIRHAIIQCKNRSKKEGTDNLPKNFGSYILEQASNGTDAHKNFVEKALNGGADKSDIANWWNLSELDRQMIKWEDEIFRIATFKNLKEQGLSEIEAIDQLRKTFPIYGDPTDENNSSGQDRPLPQELHYKVNEWVGSISPEIMKREIENYSSMNAFIRAKLNEI